MKPSLAGAVLLLALPANMDAAEALLQPSEKTADAARVVVATVRDTTQRHRDWCRRVPGDYVTSFQVRVAAFAAQSLPADQAVAGFLVGLAIALDDSSILRDNPLTSALCRRVESDAERKRRLAVLGRPTMRDRRDLCQHFVVSAALTELFGPTVAESLGLAKEMKDARGGSGFSFADMTANLAGIHLAVRLKKGELTLKEIEQAFRVEDVLPDIRGLPEGLQQADFERRYGSPTDARFRKEMDGIRERIRKLETGR